jgi:hypothetical protein
MADPKLTAASGKIGGQTGGNAKKKGKQQPPGWDQWSTHRRSMYRGISYLRRVRAIVRSGVSNLDDCCVIAEAPPKGMTPEESNDLDILIAEARGLMRTLPTLADLVGAIARQELESEPTGPRLHKE